MKWLSAGLTFVNLSVVCGLLLGMVGHGLNALSAALALVCGVAFAVAAWLGTSDPGKKSASEARISKPTWRYGKIWFWLVAAFFALFAVRSFCWLLYLDGGDWKIQSPNNLGDLSLHIAMIRNFANGVQVWRATPFSALSKLRYPVGIAWFARNVLCVFPMGRHLWCSRFFVQRRNSWLPVFEDPEVFGLSGRQQNRLEKHSAFHVRDSARMALRNPGGAGSAVALAGEILL